MNNKIRVGISHGDINGISYEIILKTLRSEGFTDLCTPVVFGSAKLMAYFRKALEIEDMRYATLKSSADIRDGEINLVNISDREFKVEPGIPSEDAGMAAFISLEAATKALKEGDIDVLVTAPINKHSIHGEDFPYSGHTEYLEAKFARDGEEALMILFDEDIALRVALVSTHLPIKEVASAVTKEKVKETIEVFNESLKRDFRIGRPTIAVLSLNPHCGDQGTIGSEDQEEVVPAVKECFDEGIMAFGPFAADGFFGTGAHRKYDGVVAMYHDQGLAPFKTLSGTGGVNFTAGLPIVRTSPDHGTGYDIAGRGIADERSLRQAIFSAIDILRHRQAYDAAKANPLKKQYVERGADKTIDLSAEE